uniref:Uncharacterized protein n=1 Tax=Brassica campestris TaxID=3711 RepID=M4FEQ8_BRACM
MSLLEASFILCRVLHLFKSRDLVWELFLAPALVDLCVVDVRGPLSPIDGGFQRFHEACSRIHPLEKMGSEVPYRHLVPAGSSLPRGFCRGVRSPLVYLRDRRLITVEVSGYLVYVRWRTRVLRGPNFASMCSLEGS